MDCEFLEVLLAMGRERLTQKQKDVLLMLLTLTEPMSVTRFVSSCRLSIGCSETAVWNAVNALRKSGLVECRRGFPVKLTSAGRMISGLLEVEE